MSDTAIETTDKTDTAIAVPNTFDGLDSGLDDFGTEDMVLPRITIDHDEIHYVDNLTNETFPKLNVVMLGLVKARVLWAEEMKDGEGPLCKSNDHKNGHPTDKFPWAASGFPKDRALAAIEEGKVEGLPCASCKLQEWGSHPSRDVPWCNEQFVLPVMMATGEGDDVSYNAPAILTFQRSGIKASKAYISAFARSKQPLFTTVTELGLSAQKKGSRTYGTPTFRKLEGTDQENWVEYSTTFRQIRDYLQTPPAARTEEEESAPVSNDAPAAAIPEDDLPF